MSQEQVLKDEKNVEATQKVVKATPPMNEKRPEDPRESLDAIRQETGQITELTSEENMLVQEFLTALRKTLEPLAQTLQVSTVVLPAEWGKVSQANLDLTGQLLVLYPNGEMKSMNLTELRHRELLFKIAHDIMPKLKRLITSHRQKIEKRIKFLSSITKELQKTANAFSPNDS